MRLEQWQDAGVDGVNIRYITTPGSFEDFIDHVVPELQSRGLAQTEYAQGTLARQALRCRYRRLPRPAPGPAVAGQVQLGPGGDFVNHGQRLGRGPPNRQML